MNIRTNNKPRDLLSGWELTAKECQELDYIENIGEECARFFRYKGWIYDMHEFMATSGIQTESELRAAGWAGYQSDSYFSGVAIKYVNDYEQVIVGQYFC